MTSGAVSIGMAAAAPLVVLFGIRGALLAAGVASIVAAVVARGLGLHRLRGEAVLPTVAVDGMTWARTSGNGTPNG
jgi:hypothetical protein